MTTRSTVLLFALLASANADTLNLRNGTSVTGSWAGLDAGQIGFLVNNQVRTYPRSDVSAVTFGPGESAPASPARVAPEPGIVGTVYLRDESGTLIPLERNKATERRSGSGSAPYWELQDARSPVRVKGGPGMTFLVRLANGINPGTFSLFPLETGRGSRRTRSGPRNNGSPLMLLFNVTEIGESTYSMSPVGDLAAGEYAFSPADSNDAWCFGVDPDRGQR